jgi:phosphatidylinositol alpha-1,6-mannosyltransferase
VRPAPRLLALVNDAFGGSGGIAQYNCDFLSALAECGAASSIAILPRHAPNQVTIPAGVQQAPPRPGRIAYAISSVRAVLTRRVDVVFCGHLYVAPLAMLVARLGRAKLIVQLHGIEAWPRPTLLRRSAVEAADLVLCVSRHTRASVLSWASIAPERVLVLPNTVAEAFTPGDGAALRAAWGLEGKCVLLTVGRLSPDERYKGHERVIGAMAHLAGDGHDVVYVVVGEGGDRARLEIVAREAGVADRVRFVGAVDMDTLVQAYRMADLFVMPSTGEGFGIAFLEALASGTPALGLAVAGAIDALGDGELGTPVTEPDFAAALTRALAHPKANEHDLAAAVRSRFGRGPFVAAVRAAFERISET